MFVVTKKTNRRDGKETVILRTEIFNRALTVVRLGSDMKKVYKIYSGEKCVYAYMPSKPCSGRIIDDVELRSILGFTSTLNNDAQIVFFI